MKTIKKLFLFVAVVGLIGYGVWYRFLREQPVRYVFQTQPVTRGAITATVSATGTVNAVEMIDVGTQVSGTIKEIYADYNSKVKKGQLIALLDPDVLKSQVDQSKANLALAQAGVVSSKASVQDATRTYNRNKELWNRNLIAKSDFDSAETALALAKATLAESNARVVQAQASLRQAETNLGYTRIVSPVDGVVIAREVDVGQTVAASMQTPTLFSIASDLTRMQIEAIIDEADIGRIMDGQEAVCKFDAWPRMTFDAKVKQVRLNPTVTSNVVTYTVVLSIDNKDLKLKPGMTANLTIITEKRDDVLRVAAAALRFSPPSDAIPAVDKPQNGNSQSVASPLGMPRFPRRGGNGDQNHNEQVVWVVQDGKLVGSLPVGEQGISDRTWIELVKSQLKEGQELAVSFSLASSTAGAALAETR